MLGNKERSESADGASVSHSVHGTHILRAFHGIDAVPGTPRRPRTGGGVLRNGLCQHHRLFGSVGSSTWDGTAMLASIRRKTHERLVVDPPPLRNVSATLLHPNIAPLAQHLKHPSTLAPGP